MATFGDGAVQGQPVLPGFGVPFEANRKKTQPVKRLGMNHRLDGLHWRLQGGAQSPHPEGKPEPEIRMYEIAQ
jgi:hypothetical protein